MTKTFTEFLTKNLNEADNKKKADFTSEDLSNIKDIEKNLERRDSKLNDIVDTKFKDIKDRIKLVNKERNSLYAELKSFITDLKRDLKPINSVLPKSQYVYDENDMLIYNVGKNKFDKAYERTLPKLKNEVLELTKKIVNFR